METFLQRLQKKAYTEVEYAGVRYRLRACVGEDMLLLHVALLAIIMPPDAQDMLTEATIKQAEGPDKEELERAYQRELFQRLNDPENQRKAHEINVAFLCASVVEADIGEGWEELRVVAREEDQDVSAAPNRIWAANLPPGTIQAVGGAARLLSFGGEENRKRIRAFRGKSSDGVVLREDGAAVRDAPDGASETMPV